MTTLPPEPNGEQPQQPAAAQPETPQPAAPQYQAPPAGAYQQPPAGGQPGGAAAVDPAVNTITLNYWLSVFFTWLPALIFWMIEKDKGNARATAFHVSNFNFSLLRTGLLVVGWIIALVPYIGWLIAAILWIGHVVLFVFHIMAAVKAAENYKNGGSTDPFIFNIPLIK